MNQTKPRYVIRLGPDGYYGSVIWGFSPIEKARVYPTMKEASRNLNRMRDRFHYNQASIEIYNEPKRTS